MSDQFYHHKYYKRAKCSLGSSDDEENHPCFLWGPTLRLSTHNELGEDRGVVPVHGISVVHLLSNFARRVDYNLLQKQESYGISLLKAHSVTSAQCKDDCETPAL